jgi:hypothetical protein
MEVTIENDNLCLPFWNLFYVVGPTSNGFDRRLNGLRARIHDKNSVFAAKLGKVSDEIRQSVGVKRARRESERIKLRVSDLVDARIAVPKIKGAVRAEEVDVTAPLNIFHPNALP